jgi:hypothetical protein
MLMTIGKTFCVIKKCIKLKEPLLKLTLVSVVILKIYIYGFEWDQRLNNLYIYVEPANVQEGQQYWRLIKAIYQDEKESGGNINICYTIVDEDGSPVMYQQVVQGWPDGQTYNYTNQDGQTTISMGGNNWCPVVGPGPYSAWVGGGIPSDKVCGMGLPCNLHVNYLLTWQKTTKGTPGGIGTIRGTVRTAGTGQIVNRVNIEVKQNGQVKYYTRTASDGRYNITVPVGNYDIVAHKNGYSTETKHNVSVNEAQVVTIDFTLTSYIIPTFVNGGFETGDLTGWTVVWGVDKNDVRTSQFAVSPYEGDYYLGQIVCQGYKQGMVSQKFKVTPGKLIIAYAYVYSDAWDGTPENSSPEDNWCRVGLDPLGLENPGLSSVVWSDIGKGFRKWTPISVSTVAQSDTMTIYLQLFQSKYHEWNKTGIDDVVVCSPEILADTTPPAMPTLNSPFHGSIVSSLPIIFDWSDVDDPSSPVVYELQIDDNDDFSSPVIAETTLTTSSYTVASIQNGTYYWRVRAKDKEGNFSSWTQPWTIIVNINNTGGDTTLLPKKDKIAVVPNIVTKTTGNRVTIEYDVSEPKEICIRIYTLSGELVKKIVKYKHQGKYKEIWDMHSDDGTEVPDGIYLIYYTTGGTSVVKKIFYVK